MNIREKLVDDWCNMHKRWSVWLAGVAIIAQGFLIEFPEVFISAWNTLPPEFKSMVPASIVSKVPIVLMLLSVIAKFIKQPKLSPPAAILLCLFFSPLAMAACPTGSACLTVEPIPGWDNGTPMRDDQVVTYTLYRFDAVKNTGVLLTSKTQAFSNKVKLLVQVDNEPAGKQCYMVDASIDTGTEIRRSPVSSTSEDCKTIVPVILKPVTPKLSVE